MIHVSYEDESVAICVALIECYAWRMLIGACFSYVLLHQQPFEENHKPPPDQELLLTLPHRYTERLNNDFISM